MDGFYNRKEAGELLEKYTQGRLKYLHRSLQVQEMYNGQNSYKIMNEGAIYRLIKVSTTESDGSVEEVTAAIQGIIYSSDIPPIYSKYPHSVNPRHLRQSLGITALNTDSFEAIYTVIAEIYNTFKLELGSVLDKCTVFSDFEGHRALDVYNRYLSSREHTPPEQIRPIDTVIDPHGYLSIAAGNKFVYSEDNVVDYYKLKDQNKSDEYSFERCRPTNFQIGDIVEIQISFAALPLRGNRFKLGLILRSVALLDNSISRRASVSRLATQIDRPISNSNIIIKRKAVYVEEEVSSTRAKLDHITFGAMDINEKTGDKRGNFMDTDNS
ncbi:hypothetical protein CVT24_000572 [Panaeolus cyanescens]|uniref:Uncharacterized protein n=1 Tax=Panaeolus cyanescens TaxID=181874 RepID=A0A409YDD6_9AGAR|nr:hypothetical protein CVT24_000572 [Panaeolus cyanescens]